MAFTFDTESDFGVDYGGIPSYSFNDAFDLDTNKINDIAYGSLNSSNGGNAISSVSKILDALDKAKTYQTQGSTRGFAAPGATVEKVGNSTYVINRAPKKIPIQQQSSGSSGLFGGLGGAAGALGTAAGVFGPLGAPIGALVGKGIDSIFG